MIMCATCLRELYQQFVRRTGRQVAAIEQLVGGTGTRTEQHGQDELQTSRECFAKLFSLECQSYVDQAYSGVVRVLQVQPYDSCDDAFTALEFLQELIATALWKYELAVPQNQESFAREYDRLDTELERRRLYDAVRCSDGTLGGAH